ncbi:amidohydrolase family protein [Negadavirga shengliensis]|uniref:Amidohydrolase family protein n=1 Tax=Negadavirga shengliensis TaxID=1389218 RepID=A0ABV9T397_9BACT
MKKNYLFKYRCWLIILIYPLLQNCQSPANGSKAESHSLPTYYGADDFPTIKKHDAHVHLRTDFDTLFIRQAEADNFSLLTVSVYTASGRPPEEQEKFSVKMKETFPSKVFYGTAFSLENFGKPDWEKQTINYLKSSFAKGAIAVKVWKNIGMEHRDDDGSFVMIDDPRFDPIWDLLEAENITLLGHLGEPKNTWLPLEEMTVQGDRDYFRENPKYHMYLHPDYPSYDELIAARDRLLEKRPRLRFVGAHLGSLEYDVDELAKRLDKYPNMAVDMAERISHLQHQAVSDWQRVHNFLIKYQDRLIYGTDLRRGASDIVAKGLEQPSEIAQHAHEVWLRHWKFFTSDETMEVPKVKGQFKGMKLPKEVVDKIYRTNAEKWYPGLLH